MPIVSSIALPRLTEADMRALDYEVMAHAFASQRELGRLCDEAVYQADFAARLEESGLGPVPVEVPVHAAFHDFRKTYFLDLVVAGRAIYELKTVTALTSAHEAQLLNYLVLTESTRGKLVNFRGGSVAARFVNTSLDYVARRNFQIETERWHGEAGFRDLVVALVRDWGTALESALYTEAVVHMLGGEGHAVRQLPMRRGDVTLGNQRFHLATPDAAFRFTAFNHDAPRQEAHLARLLEHSPLRALHWVNIGLHLVTFTTLSRK